MNTLNKVAIKAVAQNEINFLEANGIDSEKSLDIVTSFYEEVTSEIDKCNISEYINNVLLSEIICTECSEVESNLSEREGFECTNSEEFIKRVIIEISEQNKVNIYKAVEEVLSCALETHYDIFEIVQ